MFGLFLMKYFVAYLVLGYINLFFSINIPVDIKQRPLRDIGFELLPKIPHFWADRAIEAFYFIFIVYFLKSLDVLNEFFKKASILYLLRLFCFTSTILPPCIENCVSRRPEEPYIFITMNYSHGCIDHIFSGHVFHMTLICVMFYKYSTSTFLRKVFYASYIPFVVLIVSSRLHYSVDVIVSIIISSTVAFINNIGIN